MEDIKLLPVPQVIESTGEPLNLPPEVIISGRMDSRLHQTAAKELKGRLIDKGVESTIKFLTAADAPSDMRNWSRIPEGYFLESTEKGVFIYSDDETGHFYGAITLKQIFNQFGRKLPKLRIGDSPRFQHRGAMLCFPQGHMAYKPAYLKHLISQLALWKINELYLYFETYFDFPSLPGLGGAGAMTPEDVRELEAFCDGYNITLIPQLNLLGHCGELLSTQKYHSLLEYEAGKNPRVERSGNLCASSPEVGKLSETLLLDIINCFKSDIIHVGGDEVGNLGECPSCKGKSDEPDKIKLYLDYFRRLQQIAADKGRKIGLWGDMLLKHFTEECKNEYEDDLKALAKSTVIYDWHYRGGSPESVKFFVDSGFETVACSFAAVPYTASLWPAQSVNQRRLFADAADAGAAGGMTTNWQNCKGLHLEHVNYLLASGGTALWSGASQNKITPGLSDDTFEKIYSFQRYGLASDVLTRFWHTLGELTGPVLSALEPLHGVNVRQCIYHTDNVFVCWIHYNQILNEKNLKQYRKGLDEAWNLWEQVKTQVTDDWNDPYFPLQVGPLLTHEHLFQRFTMTEEVYNLYDKAAAVQYEEPEKFALYLNRAADRLLEHLEDFPDIEQYVEDARELLGLHRASIVCLEETKNNIVRIADFFRYLTRSEQILPVFIDISDMLVERRKGKYWAGRAHEWADLPAEFRSYAVENGPFYGAAPRKEQEEVMKH